MHSSKYSSDISLKKPSIVTTHTILVTEVGDHSALHPPV